MRLYWILPVLMLALAGCATKTDTPTSAIKTDIPGLKDFAETTKDLSPQQGMLTLYHGKDALWFEIPQQGIGEYGLTSTLTRGAAGVEHGWTNGTYLVEFRRNGASYSVISKDVNFRAEAGSQEAVAVMQSYADNALAQAAIETQNPANGHYLVNLQSLFTDGSYMKMLEKGLGATCKSSLVSWVKTFPENLVVETIHTMANSENSAPAEQVVLRHNLFKLPETGSFRPRPGDVRLGFFEQMIKEYTAVDQRRNPELFFLCKFHMEKQDPSAALSKPVKPIVFWIDRATPKQFRPWVKEAVLWWNKSFEKIGIKDAIEVREVPDDADWIGLDLRYNIIYWDYNREMSWSGVAGPSVVDPRTMETLQATVHLNGEFFSYAAHDFRTYTWWVAPPRAYIEHRQNRHRKCCDRAESYSSQLAFARLVMLHRGVFKKGDAEFNRYLELAFKELVSHEVGHALGFSHNFKASLLQSADKILKDGTAKGELFCASVMDYNPVNIPPSGKPAGDYLLSALGPYDDLMVEYLYTPTRGLNGTEEKTLLDRIALKAEKQNGLIYDEAFGGIDPYGMTDDLGDDPLRFAAQRFDMVREILPDLPELAMDSGDEYRTLRQAMDACVFSILADYITNSSAFIGGQMLKRHPLGGNRDLPVEPVPAEKQRDAFALLEKTMLTGDFLLFSPALRSQLAPSFHWNSAWLPTYSIEQRMYWLQDLTLSLMLELPRLERMADNEKRDLRAWKVPDYLSALRERVWDKNLQSVPTALQDYTAAITQNRRQLQAIYIDKLSDLLFNPATQSDLRSLAFQELDTLKTRLEEWTADKEDMDAYTKAHLNFQLTRVKSILNTSLTLVVNQK